MQNINYEIIKWLKEKEINYEEEFNLSQKSWLQAGGTINLFIRPQKIEEVKKIIVLFIKKKTRYYILGNISNTILRDGIIQTPIINLNKINQIILNNEEKDLEFYAESGVPIPRFANWVIKKGFSGTEGLLGIPGTLGGGIYMNASSYNNEVAKYIKNIVSITHEGEIKKTSKEDAKLLWRSSIFQKNKEIILGANFIFPKINKIDQKILNYNAGKIVIHRKKYQENNFPNLGSLFATKDLYSDIKFNSLRLFFLFLYNKFFIFLIQNKLIKNYDVISFRKKINHHYRNALDIESSQYFTISDKTINCLVNKGSKNAFQAIELILNLKKKIGKSAKLENIVLDKIL